MNKTILTYESGMVIASTEAGEKTLLHSLNFSLSEGEGMALIGETGSGKTMTALSLMGLLPSNVRLREGKIVFLGKELRSPRDFSTLLGRELVYIPQNGLEFLNPARRIRRQLYDALALTGTPLRERAELAAEKLALVGFPKPEAILQSYPHELSGGMAQRVTIALAACGAPRLILADEPTNGLDEKSRESFMELLNALFPTAAKLIITHDMAIAALCEKCMVLCKGRAMECGISQEILSEPRQPYTKALLAALVKNGLKETPVLRSERGECPFYGRCSEAVEGCRTEMKRHTDGKREWWCKDAPAR